MDRSLLTNYCVRGQIHPVLLQYLSGTLDSDPRENLLKVNQMFISSSISPFLKVVKRKGWVYSALIDYSELVKMPEFEGHTSRSLHKMYNNMQHCTRNKLKLSSGRDVTIHQVREREGLVIIDLNMILTGVGLVEWCRDTRPVAVKSGSGFQSN